MIIVTVQRYIRKTEIVIIMLRRGHLTRYKLLSSTKFQICGESSPLGNSWLSFNQMISFCTEQNSRNNRQKPILSILTILAIFRNISTYNFNFFFKSIGCLFSTVIFSSPFPWPWQIACKQLNVILLNITFDTVVT